MLKEERMEKFSTDELLVIFGLVILEIEKVKQENDVPEMQEVMLANLESIKSKLQKMARE